MPENVQSNAQFLSYREEEAASSPCSPPSISCAIGDPDVDGPDHNKGCGHGGYKTESKTKGHFLNILTISLLYRQGA